MDIGTKRACRALKREEMTSAELSARLIEAKEELKQSIEEIDRPRMAALKQEVKELAGEIGLAEMAELRERLNAIEGQIQLVEENKKLIRERRIECKNALLAKEEELRPFYEDYNLCGLQLSYQENDYQMLLQERREKKARLFSLTDNLKSEIV